MGKYIVFRNITLFLLIFEINTVCCDTPAERIIEVDIVCDSTAYRRIKSRGYDPIHYLYEAVKATDYRMASIEFSVVLVGLAIWDQRDQINVYKTLESLTVDFGQYRADVLLPRRWSDVSILVTGRELDGVIDKSGVAPLGGRCSKRDATVLMKYDLTSVDSFSSVLAHELGHSLRFEHDAPGCCTGGDNLCLMSSGLKIAHINAPRFSKCSQSTLAITMSEPQSDCLLDGITAPFKPNGVDRCGDGTVDPGEECDCGSGCLFGCCNCCKKCKLVPGAECYVGRCCNTRECTLREEGYTCRASVDEGCDIADFCSGTNSQCPDIKKVDGAVCSDARHENGFCISGKCLTRNVQCLMEWGDGIYAAPDVCYTSGINAHRNAHCGIQPNGYYINCSNQSKHNYLCGMLHCTGTDSILNLSFYKNPRMNNLITNHHCFNGVYASWQSNKGYIFVANYTKCGDSKVCYAGDCLPISEVLPLPSKHKSTVSYCGDMKVDPGETCDCGAHQCNCCDPVSCQLVPKGGPGIYDNCFTCDGNSSHLTDVPSRNYTGCDHGNGRCIAGKCHSLAKSCKEIFGTDATPAPEDIYAQNIAANVSHNNAGGYLLQDVINNQWSTTFREFRKGTADGRCGLLLCHSTNSANVMDKNGSHLETKTFFVPSSTDIRVAYFSFDSTTKAGITYKRFYPVLTMNGTPCTTLTGLPGYCNSSSKAIDRYKWNRYWYSKCVPIPK